ncbi:uncharacterized protein LOC143576417 [Bidens hawaiensis]|uniref:uncharacterized protein LOC143576417 n=1 Tax=Bidens hawaiensis TaxID=980011 RepID=UPI00404A9B37
MGADKSFISLDFAYIIGKPQNKLSKPFTVEVADGNSIIIDSVIRDCVITLNKFKFRIYLIPMKMDSFDVIVRMDWLTLNYAEVICFEKFLSQRYLHKKYVAFVSLVVDKERKEKKISNIPVVRNFPDVFPDEVSRLPPIHQPKFQIDLILGANPVAKAPYHLSPSEMQELSSQLQELLDNGFIRPSSSPWGAPVLFV